MRRPRRSRRPITSAARPRCIASGFTSTRVRSMILLSQNETELRDKWLLGLPSDGWLRADCRLTQIEWHKRIGRVDIAALQAPRTKPRDCDDARLAAVDEDAA